jgi:ElaB/YqjD/DUF883 family membrane-anchored ribosome-binding protein
MDQSEEQVLSEEEILRQQIDETKSHLYENLETLEQQVAETVQSTSASVTATVEAIQQTAESVHGAVDDAVHSVNSALDYRRHMNEHPLLTLTSVAAASFLAGYLTTRPRKKSLPENTEMFRQQAAPYHDEAFNTTFSGNTPGSSANPPAAPTDSQNNSPSPWDDIRTIAITTLLGVLQTTASHVLPQLLQSVLSPIASRPQENHRRKPTQPKLMPEPGPSRRVI